MRQKKASQSTTEVAKKSQISIGYRLAEMKWREAGGNQLAKRWSAVIINVFDVETIFS